MSRMTQFIGLSSAANNFLNTNDAIRVGSEEITEGIAMEPVYGNIYEVNGVLYSEVVQCEPWSSGPMIFTALKNEETDDVLFLWESDIINDML